MKRIKIAMAALAVTVGLVASFAFTGKKFSAVDVLYDSSPSGQRTTAKSSGTAIIASELKVDAVAPLGVPDSWSVVASIGSHSSTGLRLKGIEYQSTDFATLMDAATATYDYYIQGSVSDLPADGASFDDVPVGTRLITVFRN